MTLSLQIKFFPLCFKVAERFENLDNILHDWAKEKIQKGLADALNRYEKQYKKERQLLFLVMIRKKKYSSSLSRQSSEVKSKTKLVSKLTLR